MVIVLVVNEGFRTRSQLNKLTNKQTKNKVLKKVFPQHFNDTTPPIRLNEIRKVLLFQDIFHVLIVSQ